MISAIEVNIETTETLKLREDGERERDVLVIIKVIVRWTYFQR